MAAGSTYTPIATTTLGSDTASVSFSSFSGYTDLVLIVNGRTSRADDNDALQVRFNSDSGTNYSFTSLYGDGTTAGSGRSSSDTSITLGRLIGSGTGSTPSMVIAQFMNYANSTTYKTTLGRSSNHSANYSAYANVGLWRSTSAITSMLLYPAVGPNFKSGSTFTLYGIQAA